MRITMFFYKEPNKDVSASTHVWKVNCSAINFLQKKTEKGVNKIETLPRQTITRLLPYNVS